MPSARTTLALVVISLWSSRAAMAQPQMTLSTSVVAPGQGVTVTVTGGPGQSYAIIGSSVNGGFSYGGVALAVGADVVMLAQGVLGASGQAAVSVIPPFQGSVLDRYYLQAVTSPATNFLPLAVSSGQVVRNSDLVSGLTGPMGPPGVVPTNGTGAFDFSNVNGFVAQGTMNIGALGETGGGTRLVWYPRKAAFRAGSVIATQWDDVNIGEFSAALGSSTTASGPHSTALGNATSASGYYSTATGNFTIASGSSSTAMGNGTMASGNSGMATGTFTSATGDSSTAMGFVTSATGVYSTAMGAFTVASGNWSTAMGRAASTNGHTGAFVYGDSSTETSVVPTANNQYVVRASGGTLFYSDSAMTAGVSLPANGGAWNTLSDVRMKANFSDLDGEDVLAKLARMPIRQWNYITQDASIRHVGPTAQDFHAAFSLGDSDRTISTLDPDGIALRAIQALDARTQDTQTDVARLTDENAALREELAALRRMVEGLKRNRR